MQPAIDKKTLRQDIIQHRDALSPYKREQLSLTVAKNVLAWPLYRQAKTVFLFAGVRSEIDTKFLTEESLRLGKRVAMPRCIPGKREMLLLEIESWADLQPGYFGLLEPKPTARFISCAEVDLIVVPGVVFSPDGYRIGYGGGYYDRLLDKLTDPITVGIAFQLQVVSYLPQETHDKPVEFLITEKGLIDCRIVRAERIKKGDGNSNAR